MKYFEKDLTSLHDDLVAKRISVTDLVKATFDNIAATDPELNAFFDA